jgi:hypothetical protein
MSHNRFVLMAAALAVACSRAPALSNQGNSGSPPEGSPAVVAWLDCVECTADQLHAVASLGDRAVPIFNEVMLRGPSTDRLASERRHLESTYQALKDYERQHPGNRVPFTQQEYIQLYLQKFVLLNQIRSVHALAAIATDAAKGALRAARQQPNLPAEIKIEIEQQLK